MGGEMLSKIGEVLILFGILALLFGDKPLAIKGGWVLRGFDAAPWVLKLRKWTIGVAAIIGGFMILQRTGWVL